MAITRRSTSANGGHAQAEVPPLTRDEILELGESHLATLAGGQRTPPGARLTRMPRLRRQGRRVWVWAVWTREAIVRPWRFAWNPRRPLGRWWAHLRLARPRETLNGWKGLLLLFAVAMGFLTFWRFSKPPLDVTKWLWSSKSDPWWQTRAGAAVTGTLFTGSVVGLLASLWNDLFRCPWLGFRIRQRIRREPGCVLHPHLGERRIKLVPVQDPLELVPRVDLFDEVMDGVLARDRKGVQIIVGEPGAGKTTALIELAGVLARIGVLPVLLPLRAKQDVEDVVKLARVQFKEQIEPFVRSDGESELLWRWLSRRGRVAILVDDLDQIGPDGERGYMMRRTLEEAATRELPVVVTARPAGVPAGIAASSIELGRLEDATAADCVEKGAREDPAFSSAAGVSRRRLEDWIREGALADVPFYLELLAHLVAGGRCPTLPAPDPHAIDGEHGGRYRRTPDGGYKWNRLWVRFLLLERFYEEASAGRVRRWLGIEAGESRSSLLALEGAALGTLAAAGIRARTALEHRGESCGERERKGPLRERVDDFVDTNDREPQDARRGSLDCDLRSTEEGRRPRVSAHEVVDTGERLRILDCDPKGELQFRHRIMQAYLAGCRLAVIERDRTRHPGSPAGAGHDSEDGHKWVEDLLDATHPEKLTAHMALTFAALGAQVECEAASHEAMALEGAKRKERKQDALAWHEVAKEIVRRLLEQAGKSLRLDEHETAAVGAVLALGEDREGRPVASAALFERHGLGARRDRESDLSEAIDPTHAPNPEDRADPDDALMKLTTAAEVACAIGCPADVAGRIVELVRASHFATRWTKLEAIKAIAQLRTQESWECVWEFARDHDYLVRQEASAALGENAFDAYNKLRADIKKTIVRASARSALGLPLARPEHRAQQDDESAEGAAAPSQPQDDDYAIGRWSEDHVLKLKALAWILPAIVSGLREDPATHALEGWRGREGGERLDSERPSRSLRLRRGREEGDYAHFPDLVRSANLALEQLVALSFQGGQHTLEAVLALGFKGDAMRHAHGRRDPAEQGSRTESGTESEATAGPASTAGPGWVASNRRLVLEVCLERAGSWYARLLLYQALALYTIAGAGREEAFDAFARFVHRSSERHPFTQRGARLARAAIRRARLGTDGWHPFIWDDEGAVAGREQAVLSRPAAQLAADVTVLLDLKEGSPDDRRDPFGGMRQLPHCLSASRDRAEILGKGCPDSCGWGFCPYKQPPPDEPSAHRGVTRTFCRQQQRYARHHRPLWQRRIRRRQLRAFWEEMERRART
ncbi:MAG: NACHT domain-containing protein [Solirubrobacterales bacterium]